MIYTLPLPDRWISVTDKRIDQLLKGNEQEREMASNILESHAAYVQNPLAFFKGHGEQADFVNDDESELCIITSGNQVGKTIALLAWLARRTVKMDKSWPTFGSDWKGGLKWRDWEGPRTTAGLASYEMSIHCRRNLWPKLRDTLPKSLMTKKGKNVEPPNWNAAPCVQLLTGERIDFFAYRQLVEAFESMTYNRWAFDEQVPDAIFKACFARGISIKGFQAAIAMTPHLMQGRPDTGSNGWVMKMINGLIDMGVKYKVYRIGMDDVPDEIISAAKKKQAFRMYITKPQESGNMRAIRNGRARYYGEAESSEGLVYDNFDENLHVIDDIPIPSHWTKGRGVDPGRIHPCACLYWAMSPWGDLVIYDEYWATDRLVEQNVEAIIEQAGNSRRCIDEAGRLFEEVESGTSFFWSVMDGRAFKHPLQDSTMTLGQLFASYGLDCIQGSGMKNKYAVPIVKEWFNPIKGRSHILERMKLVPKGSIVGFDGQPITGAPRIYICTRCRHLRLELKGYVNKEGTEDPVDKDDDCCTCLKYIILQGPTYMGPPDSSTEPRRSVDIPPKKGLTRRPKHTIDGISRFKYH